MKIGLIAIFFAISNPSDGQFLSCSFPENQRPLWHWTDSSLPEMNPCFPVHGIIFPAAFIAYGFITPHLDVLIDLNENVKYDAWTKSAHKTIPFDTYLQFVPAVAVYGLNWVGVKGEHDFVDRSMIYFISNVFMAISVYTVKTISHVQRPDGSGFNSFPSGHSSEAFLSRNSCGRNIRTSPFFTGWGDMR